MLLLTQTPFNMSLKAVLLLRFYPLSFKYIRHPVSR
jgi:hypothetical protein